MNQQSPQFRDYFRRSARQRRPNILGNLGGGDSRGGPSGLCQCLQYPEGTVDVLGGSMHAYQIAAFGTLFSNVADGSPIVYFDTGSTWILDEQLERHCDDYDGTETYDLTLTVGGSNAGDVSVQLSGGTECPIDATWKNPFPWLPLRSNYVALQPGYDAPTDVLLPCGLCVNPAIETYRCNLLEQNLPLRLGITLGEIGGPIGTDAPAWLSEFPGTYRVDALNGGNPNGGFHGPCRERTGDGPRCGWERAPTLIEGIADPYDAYFYICIYSGIPTPGPDSTQYWIASINGHEDPQPNYSDDHYARYVGPAVETGDLTEAQDFTFLAVSSHDPTYPVAGSEKPFSAADWPDTIRVFPQ